MDSFAGTQPATGIFLAAGYCRHSSRSVNTGRRAAGQSRSPCDRNRTALRGTGRAVAPRAGSPHYRIALPTGVESRPCSPCRQGWRDRCQGTTCRGVPPAGAVSKQPVLTAVHIRSPDRRNRNGAGCALPDRVVRDWSVPGDRRAGKLQRQQPACQESEERARIPTAGNSAVLSILMNLPCPCRIPDSACAGPERPWLSRAGQGFAARLP